MNTMMQKYKDKILLVDDEPITLKLTRKLLAEAGYEVHISSGSQSAMEKLSEDAYDLVIVDISMPSISGFELIQLMRSMNINSPVIFLSNNDNQWTIEEAHSNGAERFVSKEKEFNFLPEIVKEVLDAN